MQLMVNAAEQLLSKLGISNKQALDYTTLLTGQVGRLVFSFVYFIALARTLSLGDFGIFTTISALGIVLSRFSGLGFVSPLFRVATVKPQLIGTYTGGFLVASLVSVPVLMGLATVIYSLLYANLISLTTFITIILAEIVIWRGLEVVIIVNNGLGKYSIGSGLSIAGGAMKAVAATAFFFSGSQQLDVWTGYYLISLAALTVPAIIIFYPKQRLRWAPKAWFGRASDAFGVSSAEFLFYVQSELDKVLVLALGGEVLAGLYAIVMRLVDLTAMPLRALSPMLTQWIMRARRSGNTGTTGMKLDLIIALVSVAGLIAIAALLSFVPGILGNSIAMGAGFLWLVMLVPAFRNAIELHTDLLYGHERMAPRVVLLIYLGVMKAMLLAALLNWSKDFSEIAIWLNLVFAILYVVSVSYTYLIVLKKSKANQ